MKDVHLSAYTVQVIVSFFIPLVTGLLTKATLPRVVKGLITLFLTAVSALITMATQSDGTALVSQATFLSWALGFAVAVTSYLGIHQPANLTSNPGGKLAPDVGIGPSTPPQP